MVIAAFGGLLVGWVVRWLLGAASVLPGTAELSGWLATVLAFDNIVMVAYFADAQPMMLHAKGRKQNFLPNLGSYVSSTYRLDPFHQIHAGQRPDGLYRLSDVAPDHFQRSRYYIDYYKSTDMQDELAFATRLANGTSVHVCLGKVNRLGRRFEARAVAAGRAKQNQNVVRLDASAARQRLAAILAQNVDSGVSLAARNQSQLSDADVFGMLADLKELGTALEKKTPESES